MYKKGRRNGPGTEGFHMRPHLLQLAWSCGRTLETTPKKHLIIILFIDMPNLHRVQKFRNSEFLDRVLVFLVLEFSSKCHIGLFFSDKNETSLNVC